MVSKVKVVKFNEITIRKAEELIQKFPEFFENFSQVARSGIHHLYKERIEDKKNGLL